MTGIFEVRPSDVSPDDIAPELQVLGGTYDTNVPHIVYPAINTETLIVLVSGTGATPSASGSFLSSVNETHKLPVIGLSYIFGPFTDAHRNEMIKNGPNGRDPRVQQEILRGYHEDVLFGGNKSGLVDIPYNSSLTTRLLNLLLYLIRERPAEEGWIKFLTEESLPVWERILFVGYSQGAGHLLYLATRERFRGLILISGSQEIVPEDCEGTSWMEEAVYRTSNMFAFKHEREENGALMDLNWRSIKPLRLSKEEYAHTREQEKLRVAAVSVEATRLVGGRCFHVNEEPRPNSSFSRPFHCSMILDSCSPDAPGFEPPKLFFHTLYPFMIQKALSSDVESLSRL